MKLWKPMVSALVAAALLGSGSILAATLQKHTDSGVKCEACHGKDMKIKTPDIGSCKTCHNLDELVQKTEKTKPANPHTSPHYGNELECTNCHSVHGESQNACAQCHNFDWKVL